MIADTAAWGTRNAHDPTVVRGDDGLWYMFSTDAAAGAVDIPAGGHVRTSPDLVRWTFAGTALPGVPDAARVHAGAVGLWAPEVVRWPSAAAERRWYMYYSASSFGSRTSAIGLATAPAPSGPWTDEGLVVTTEHAVDAHNAIDAAVTFDRSGTPWLTYGSFFDGIRTLRLDPAGGRAADGEGSGVLIARRPASVDGAIEGAYIVHRPERDDYVLHVSYDSLFDSYSMRVGVAREITGPYLDAAGLPLLDPPAGSERIAGTKILGSHRFAGGTGWIAPGHGSVFADGQARFTVHHVRRADDPNEHEAHIRRLHTTDGGWPVVSPLPFAGHERERLDAVTGVTGRWQVIQFDPAHDGLVEAESMRVSGEVRTDGAAVTGSLTVDTGAGIELDAAVFGGWDPVARRAVLAFSGIDADGVVWSGVQEEAS